MVSGVGVVFLGALVATGWAALSLLLAPFAALALVPVPAVAAVTRPLYRRVAHFTQWAWMGNVAFLIVPMTEKLYGVGVSISSDEATAANLPTLEGERALWLSNHRTRIDWMLLWSLALRTRSLDQLKIVLKAPLRHAPMFGWAMQHFLFIFLNRRWADDEQMLEAYLPFLSRVETRASYLIFPEGTDLADNNLEKSAAFAKKNGLPERRYSLYPRTTGWSFIFPRLRESLDAVYDVTMFYVDYAPNERPSEAALLSGRMPRSIHFHLERIAIAAMPEDDATLAQWVETRFARKETHLQAYYEHNGRLPEGAHLLPGIGNWAWAWGLWSLVYASIVAAGHVTAAVAFGGVDHILQKTL